jgi:anti-sigma factor RsiW
MCDEREPLLAYLYGESDPEEQRRVESHLESCEACRDELAGLRSVREDLLAWDVPDHGSVWKPFTPARPVWSWRDVPAWTMAAAAAVMLALGATGSVAANAVLAKSGATATPAPVLMSAGVPVARSVVDVLKPTAAASVTRADLAALEAHLLDEVNRRAQPTPVPTSLTSSDYEKLVEIVRELNNTVATSLATKADVARLSTRLTELSATVAQLTQNQQGGR